MISSIKIQDCGVLLCLEIFILFRFFNIKRSWKKSSLIVPNFFSRVADFGVRCGTWRVLFTLIVVCA